MSALGCDPEVEHHLPRRVGLRFNASGRSSFTSSQSRVDGCAARAMPSGERNCCDFAFVASAPLYAVQVASCGPANLAASLLLLLLQRRRARAFLRRHSSRLAASAL